MAVTSTTLSIALPQNDQYMVVASATGFAAGKFVQIGAEFAYVNTVSGLRIGIGRGRNGTQQVAHARGQAVHVGSPTDFPLAPVAAPNVSIQDSVDGKRHITTAMFDNLSMGATTNASLAMGKLLFTLPAGAILIKGSNLSVAVTGSGVANAADTPDLGIGTLIGSGAQSTLNNVGATAENILTGQTVGDCVGTVCAATVTTNVSIETAGTKTIYLNISDGWAGIATIYCSGSVVVEWLDLG
jgi:hypothetical protein